MQKARTQLSVCVDLGVEEQLGGAVVLDAKVAILADVDLTEGLVAKAPVGVVAPLVHNGAVGQQVQRVVKVTGASAYSP